MLRCMQLASIADNRCAFVRHVGSRHAASSARAAYFGALNEVQKHRFPFDRQGGGYLLVFSPPDADTRETLRHFLDLASVEDLREYDGAARERIAAGMIDGARALRQLRPEYSRAAHELVGAFLFAPLAGAGGGSQADILGAVWLSPPSAWNDLDFAEAILHETVHQALFLDQMIHPTYTASFEDMRDALIISAIRRTERPFDLAFHAAGVAAVLADFYAGVEVPGAPRRARDLIEGLDATLPGLRQRADLLTERGESLLTEMEHLAASAGSSVSA